MLRRLNFHYLLAITLCVLFALLNFVDGRGGASELQPLVLRFIDSHYLENDFFVNSSEIYNVRHYIVRYLSLFVNFFGIERGMHIAGLLSFISTLFFVYLISFKLTANVLTSFIVLFFAIIPRNAGIDLGEWFLVSNQIGANQLVMPLILGGLYFVLSQKNLIALILFSILSFLHPLLGLEMISLFVLYIFFFENKIMSKVIVLMTFSIIIGNYIFDLTQVSDLFYFDAVTLKEILIEYRHPHHYLIFNNGFLGPFIFLILLLISWLMLQSNSKVSVDFINMFFFIMLPLSLFSIISINFYPLHIAISSIPFRLLSVIGYLVIIISFGMIVSQVMSLNFKYEIFLGLKTRYYLMVFIIFFSLCMVAINSIQHKRLLVLNNVIDGIIPIDQDYIDLVNFSSKINELTEPDATIITSISEIKFLSNRATFEGSQFPFIDVYMEEWYKRRKDLSQADTDDSLQYLKIHYSLDGPIYAVIGSKRKTKFSSLYCNQTLCLIKI